MISDFNCIEQKVMELISNQNALHDFAARMQNHKNANPVSSIKILINSAQGFFELSSELYDLTETIMTWTQVVPGTEKLLERHRAKIQSSTAYDQYGQVYCLSALRELFFFFTDVCSSKRSPNAD